MSQTFTCTLFLLLGTLNSNVLLASEVSGNEAIIVPCEGCEAVFQGLPAQLGSDMRLVDQAQAGETLLVQGTIYNAEGQRQAGVVLYAYQTDASGIYPGDPSLTGAAARHGRLRGWVMSDAQGDYTIRTIRPASYPDSTVEQHIHMHVIEPGRCTYYLGDVLFADDPKLSERHRQRQDQAYGGNGVVRLQGDASKGWSATRHIHLGMNVPDYQKCNARERG